MHNPRKATPDDAPTLADLHVASWRTAYAGIVPEEILQQRDVAYRTKHLREFLSQGEGETYLIEREGVIAGFMTIGATRDEDDEPTHTGEIWGIYLHPDRWRQGIGTALCHAAEERLRERGCQEITLWVLEKNASAQSFYRAMGFLPDGKQKRLTIGVELVALRYRKAID